MYAVELLQGTGSNIYVIVFQNENSPPISSIGRAKHRIYNPGHVSSILIEALFLCNIWS